MLTKLNNFSLSVVHLGVFMLSVTAPLRWTVGEANMNCPILNKKNLNQDIMKTFKL
jgi:hypothetical protein